VRLTFSKNEGFLGRMNIMYFSRPLSESSPHLTDHYYKIQFQNYENSAFVTKGDLFEGSFLQLHFYTERTYMKILNEFSETIEIEEYTNCKEDHFNLIKELLTSKYYNSNFSLEPSKYFDNSTVSHDELAGQMLLTYNGMEDM
jgi:hypothetical protein